VILKRRINGAMMIMCINAKMILMCVRNVFAEMIMM